MAATAVCPECDAEIEVAGVEVGEIVPCGECGADLEVVSVEPVTLALAPEEGEDWGEKFLSAPGEKRRAYRRGCNHSPGIKPGRTENVANPVVCS